MFYCILYRIIFLINAFVLCPTLWLFCMTFAQISPKIQPSNMLIESFRLYSIYWIVWWVVQSKECMLLKHDTCWFIGRCEIQYTSKLQCFGMPCTVLSSLLHFLLKMHAIFRSVFYSCSLYMHACIYHIYQIGPLILHWVHYFLSWRLVLAPPVSLFFHYRSSAGLNDLFFFSFFGPMEYRSNCQLLQY